MNFPCSLERAVFKLLFLHLPCPFSWESPVCFKKLMWSMKNNFFFSATFLWPAVTLGRFDRSVTSPVADTIAECVTQFPLGLGCAGHPCSSVSVAVSAGQVRHTLWLFVKAANFCSADLDLKVCIYLSLVQVRGVFHQTGSFMFSVALLNCWNCESFKEWLPCASIPILSSFGDGDVFRLH